MIDPGLAYSTFLGEMYPVGFGIAVDAQGSAYVTGATMSAAYPTTPGAHATSLNGEVDAFVTKLSPSGSALAYSTFLGGDDHDYGQGIAVDAQGNAYVTGTTVSSSFPTTAGAYDTSVSGGGDVFVSKLVPSGTQFAYSTLVGGATADESYAIAIDGQGSAYVTGYTHSVDFPTTPGAFDTTQNGGSLDVFVTKLAPSGGQLAYSTFLGGTGLDRPGQRDRGRRAGQRVRHGHHRLAGLPDDPRRL